MQPWYVLAVLQIFHGTKCEAHFCTNFRSRHFIICTLFSSRGGAVLHNVHCASNFQDRGSWWQETRVELHRRSRRQLRIAEAVETLCDYILCPALQRVLHWDGPADAYGVPWFWGECTRKLISLDLNFLFMHLKFSRKNNCRTRLSFCLQIVG